MIFFPIRTLFLIFTNLKNQCELVYILYMRQSVNLFKA